MGQLVWHTQWQTRLKERTTLEVVLCAQVHTHMYTQAHTRMRMIKIIFLDMAANMLYIWRPEPSLSSLLSNAASLSFPTLLKATR